MLTKELRLELVKLTYNHAHNMEEIIFRAKKLEEYVSEVQPADSEKLKAKKLKVLQNDKE